MPKRFFFVIVLLGGVVAFQSDNTKPNQAAVVVRFEDDHVESRCVSFEEQQISGFDLLERSQFQIAAQVEGTGIMACQIDGTGCPTGDCFCQCKGGDECVYWSYWRHGEDGWRYSQLGAGTAIVRDGTVDGWSWGPGSLVYAVQPPEVTFDEVCSQDAKTPVDEQRVAGDGESIISTYGPFGLFIVLMGGALLLLKLKK